MQGKFCKGKMMFFYDNSNHSITKSIHPSPTCLFRVASGLEAIPAVTPCTGCQSVVGQENYIMSSISVGTATVEEYLVYLFINKRSSKG